MQSYHGEEAAGESQDCIRIGLQNKTDCLNYLVALVTVTEQESYLQVLLLNSLSLLPSHRIKTDVSGPVSSCGNTSPWHSCHATKGCWVPAILILKSEQMPEFQLRRVIKSCYDVSPRQKGRDSEFRPQHLLTRSHLMGSTGPLDTLGTLLCHQSPEAWDTRRDEDKINPLCFQCLTKE